MKKYIKPTIFLMATRTQQLMATSLPIDGDTSTDIAYGKKYSDFEDDFVNNDGFDFWKRK